MTQRVSLSIEQWISLREGGGSAPPLWFTVTGGSMRPLIRVGRDQVMLVSVDPEEIQVGDMLMGALQQEEQGDISFARGIKNLKG